MPDPRHILLAIDDEQALQLFRQAFAAGANATTVADDGPALEKTLQESSPDLIIVSQAFDGRDEFEVAAALLERFPTLPVLLFFRQPSPEAQKKALYIGVSDCLFAPLRLDDIERSVENSVRKANRIGDWTRREIRSTTASLQQRVNELQKIDTVMANIEDGVIILDDRLDILLINPAARRAFGLWKDEAVNGRPVVEVLPHPDLKALLEADKSNPILHHEIVFDDGRVLSAQYTPIPNIGVAITMQDITYLKQIDRLKNEFIHMISHDVRSPLTAILGYMDLIERAGPVTAQQAEFVKRSKESVKHITVLINDLLELGRIEAGLDIQKETVALETVIRHAADTFEGQIEDKQLNFGLKFPPAGVPGVRGNSIRLRQLVDNLIGNAIKYTPEKGDISVELEAQGEQLIFRVIDTGPGIPPADQPQIFEKFYRASNVPKGVGGSGLGLAIVKSIVDSHQGRVWVDSALGKGSTFTVVLPVYSTAGE